MILHEGQALLMVGWVNGPSGKVICIDLSKGLE